MGQPIYLVIVAFVTAIIIAILLVSVVSLTLESQTNVVEREIDKILSQSTTMFEYANEGACATVSVHFPSSMRFIVFGDLPEHTTEPPANLSENELVINSYYYIMADGSIHTGHAPVRFSGENTSQIAVFKTGMHTLHLVLIQFGEKTYVKIYE
ncbi:MAG TPA: hypothetical protein VMT57_04165 [Candidatus Thermoplasmatota archaeon]|nr:hypothetical protein [Candidatus Thermoplasmatota archaeon]